MQQNQRAFDQQQALHRSTNEAVNNSLMNTYRTSQQASDRGQQQFRNTTSGEETLTNPYDGQQYQVESGADQYWMNRSGENIQSNDAFYDPNMDQTINNQEWQKVEPAW
ncbi:MAG: hypothetical protein V3W04_10260 [Gammaproteobacteria bacterium]